MTHPDNENVTRPASEVGALGPKAVLAAQRQGHEAAVAGAAVDACPWARAATPAERDAREAWVRGYAAGRTRLRSASAPPDA